MLQHASHNRWPARRRLLLLLLLLLQAASVFTGGRTLNVSACLLRSRDSSLISCCCAPIPGRDGSYSPGDCSSRLFIDATSMQHGVHYSVE